MLEAGADQSVESRKFGVHESIVSPLVQHFACKHGDRMSVHWTSTSDHVTAGLCNAFNALRKPWK